VDVVVDTLDSDSGADNRQSGSYPHQPGTDEALAPSFKRGLPRPPQPSDSIDPNFQIRERRFRYEATSTHAPSSVVPIWCP
jgi:hypothetical protein